MAKDRKFVVKATSETWEAGQTFDEEGAFETVRFHDENSGFVIGQFRTKRGDTIVCKGTVPAFVLGAPYHIVGKVIDDKQWGIQVNISSAGASKPSTTSELIAFLGSGSIPGIGPVTAKRIVKTFGKDTLKVLEDNPQRLIEVPGIGEKSLKKIIKTLPAQLKYREIIGYFAEMGISITTINRLINEYGSRTREVIEKNPYILCRVRGFAFTRADSIAMRMGVSKYAPERLYAGLLATLRWMCENNGHTVVPRQMLMDEAVQKLGITDIGKLDEALDQLTDDGRVLSDELGCHLKHLFNAEKTIKSYLAKSVDDDILIRGSKVDELIEQCGTRSGISLTDEQEAAVKKLYRKRFSIMTGGAGVGKAQPLYSKILTEYGWKTMGELEVGMKIYTREGTLCPIRKLHPQGEKEIYRVHFSDGRYVDCCNEHIWTVYTSKGNFIDKTVNEMLEHGLEGKDKRPNHHKYWFRVPLNQPIQFPEKDLPIDPYVLGGLIGDGYLCGSGVYLSTNDEEILEEFRKRLPLYDIHKTGKMPEEGGNYSWIISCPDADVNPLRRAIKELGLNVRTECKFIPKEYLYASVEQRRDLLKGLMDTDGCSQSGRFSFTTINRQLKDDFMELCRSLGYSVTAATDNRSEKYVTGECWRVQVWSNDVENIFLLPRKKKAFYDYAAKRKSDLRIRKNYALSIVKIEKLNEKTEMQCLELDQPDDGEHLYITDNYIVTHNTATCRMAVDVAKAAGLTVCLMAPTGRAAKHLSDVCGAPGYTMHRALAIVVREAQDDDFFSDDEADTLQSRAITEAVEHFKNSDVIIADEASMMDTEMAAILFRACKKKHLMLVGDPNQLPSVGPGRVLGDIMDSSYASIHGLVTRLTKIFRQAEGSPVIEAANLVTEGKSPCYVRGVTFLESDNEHVPEMLEKYVIPMLKDNKYSYDEWMVLAPMKKTPYSGVNALNTFMRPFMNPYYKKPKNEKLDFLYQKGDLIIQLKNNYTADIYNGDIGIVQDVDDEGNFEVLFSGDDETVIYEKDEISQTSLCNAMTIHKSQGGQADVVVVILTESHFVMLNRNLLYTAITRCSDRLVLIGSKRAFAQAASNQKENKRMTGLVGI